MRAPPGHEPTATASVPKEENPMTLDEIHEGMRVLYLPPHAHGDRTHPDCQRGIVTSKNPAQVFVRYGDDRHSHATLPALLVPDDAVLHTWRSPFPPDRQRGT